MKKILEEFKKNATENNNAFVKITSFNNFPTGNQFILIKNSCWNGIFCKWFNFY
jgi:hypothetical protein